MRRPAIRQAGFVFGVLAAFLAATTPALAEGEWEVTPQSELALERGLKWLADNQGSEGNWTSNDLGLVSMGALAFMAAGHLPGHGPQGEPPRRALDYVIREAQKNPSGLLNIADEKRGMYNHGLAAFVIGQAYGMSGDERVGPALDGALKLIAQTQCRDGGWDYVAKPQPRGHDLSLAVMQAKALRGAVDSGLDVPPEVIEMAIRSVRDHYTPDGCSRTADEETQKRHPGQFTYTKGGGSRSVAMAAAGVVCLQEFAQYDDWRIAKSMDFVCKEIRDKCRGKSKETPFDAYTLYYVGQALYQVGGKQWQDHYPLLRDSLVACQISAEGNAQEHGKWKADGRVGGKPGDLYMTSAACFILAMPYRYLPILQEGKIDSLQQRFRRD